MGSFDPSQKFFEDACEIARKVAYGFAAKSGMLSHLGDFEDAACDGVSDACQGFKPPADPEQLRTRFEAYMWHFVHGSLCRKIVEITGGYKDFYYRVKVTNESGSSSYSESVFSGRSTLLEMPPNRPTDSAIQVLPPPTGLTAVPAQNRIKISWESVPGITAYVLEYSSDGTEWRSLYEGQDTSYTHILESVRTGEDDEEDGGTSLKDTVSDDGLGGYQDKPEPVDSDVVNRDVANRYGECYSFDRRNFLVGTHRITSADIERIRPYYLDFFKRRLLFLGEREQ